MELKVYKTDGKESGKTVTLDARIFGVTPNDHAIYLDVRHYLAAQRQGTARTKDRSEVCYSTKKQGRQKGGGGARHGSIKAGIYVGGGTVFGPKPRDYRFKLNKKVKQLARFSALTYKATENKIVLVEPFSFEQPKTKDFAAILSNIKAGDRKVLVVLPSALPNVYTSSRNLPEVKVITVDEINTYTIMKAHSLVLVDGVQEILAERIK